jgi:hypothetical protein
MSGHGNGGGLLTGNLAKIEFIYFSVKNVYATCVNEKTTFGGDDWGIDGYGTS